MAIQLKKVAFSYANSAKKNVIKIDNWSVPDGKKVLLCGPSGSGKSTLLNLICGLLLPNSGSIHTLGEQINHMNNHQRDAFRAKNIGYIFQQFNLVTYLNAIENIKLAHYFSANKQKSDISHSASALLESLNIDRDDWYRPVNTLSIGQQQRIGIARSFINKPKLLIADEPTSSLDDDAKNNFISLIFKLCDENNSTLLFVSHDKHLEHHFDLVEDFSLINRKPSKNDVYPISS